MQIDNISERKSLSFEEVLQSENDMLLTVEATQAVKQPNIPP